MASIEEFSTSIDELLKANQARREGAEAARQDAMRDWEDRRNLFDERAQRWMRAIALPLLRLLAEKFRHADPTELSESGLRVGVHFPRTDEFPADATVLVRVVHEAGFERAWLVFEASIIPMLMDYEQKASLDLNDLTDSAAVEGFIQARILRFVADYLRVLDPASYYQKSAAVTDPVCGMTFRRADAATIQEYEGRRYYFCAANCRELFVSDPARYVRLSQSLGPRTEGRTSPLPPAKGG